MPYSGLIGPDYWKTWLHDHDERQVSSSSRSLILLTNGPHQRGKIYRLQRRRDVSRLGASQLVEVVDERERPTDAAANASDALALFGG